LRSLLPLFYGRHHDLVNSCGICVTNDHVYVLFIVITIRPYPHSWITTGFVTRVIRRVPIVEQELLTLPEHLRSYCSIFSFLCSVLHIIVWPFDLFLFWSLYCLFFCGLWLLLTPLASSHFPYNGTISVVTISLEISNTSRSPYIRLSYNKQK
jgi:hypothetical protein